MVWIRWTLCQHNNEFSGYLLLATSFEDSKLLLSNLSTILFILYPVVLLFLFLTLRRLASRSIQPIIDITQKAEIITTDKLNAILDQLLTLARLQKSPSDGDEVDLNFLIKDLLASAREQNPTRGIQLEVRSNKNLYIKANEKSLAIIIENLIQNALKYSSEDQDIKLILEKGMEGVFLHIKDLGIGISEEELTKIHQPFFRGESHELGRINGAGLGLSIVKKLCDFYKIGLLTQSKKGEGSTFSLLFPPSLQQS